MRITVGAATGAAICAASAGIIDFGGGRPDRSGITLALLALLLGAGLVIQFGPLGTWLGPLGRTARGINEPPSRAMRNISMLIGLIGFVIVPLVLGPGPGFVPLFVSFAASMLIVTALPAFVRGRRGRGTPMTGARSQ